MEIRVLELKYKNSFNDAVSYLEEFDFDELLEMEHFKDFKDSENEVELLNRYFAPLEEASSCSENSDESEAVTIPNNDEDASTDSNIDNSDDSEDIVFITPKREPKTKNKSKKESKVKTKTKKKPVNESDSSIEYEDVEAAAEKGAITLKTFFSNNKVPDIKDFMKSIGLKYDSRCVKSELIETATKGCLRKYNRTAYDSVKKGGNGQPLHRDMIRLKKQCNDSYNFLIRALDKKTMTVLKEYCLQCGVKPGSLNKPYLVRMIADIIIKGDIGPLYSGLTFQYDELKAVSFEQRHIDNWKQTLKKHGVAIVPIEDFDYNYVLEEFYNWMESIDGCKFTREEKDHKYFTDLPTSTHCIFKSFLCHENWMWYTRSCCRYIFEELWETDKLLCSFDGASFIPTPSDILDDEEKSWFHMDQGRPHIDKSKKECRSYQGVVYLTDSDTDDGGFCYIEGTHKIYDEYLKKYPTYGYTFGGCNIEDEMFAGRRKIKLNVPKGHILLFDSRLVHSNIKSRNNSRACVYVTMMPKENASDAELNRRIDWYNDNKGTGHWCYGPLLKPTSRVPYRGKTPEYIPEITDVVQYNELTEDYKDLIA